METLRKHIAIYCVNYHSYDSLNNYLASIDQAVQKSKNDIELTVFVADNSVPAQPIPFHSELFMLHLLQTGQNLGYFGAVKHLMEHYPPTCYDYAIISNADVVIPDDFFGKLSKTAFPQHTGWIAPQIFSRQEQRDRNPKILQRYPKKKLQILKCLFTVPPLYNLYTHTAYKSKKFIHHQPGQIYAGHGSFIILTNEYFQRCGIIDYPVFLFCEEIYLAEQCLQQNLRVLYCPELCIHDAEHASTSNMRRSRYCQLNKQAITHILNTYYNS